MPAPDTAGLGEMTSAFADACRLARSEGELYERCRVVLTRRFGTDRIWLTLDGGVGESSRLGPAEGAHSAVEIASLVTGETRVGILADESAAEAMRGTAMALALGIGVVSELREVLVDRQAELDDAVFQLRALRQVARLLSSVHSAEETEQLVLDFMSEVFFAWWACLYRPKDDKYEPAVFRTLTDDQVCEPIERKAIDPAVHTGAAAVLVAGSSLEVILPGAQVVVPLDAGAERMAVLVLGPRISDKSYGPAEMELASTLAFAAAIALKNALLVEQLQSAATTDELTGLYNRRALEDRLAAEISRSLRHQLHTSILLIDLDRFKNINDTLGHAAGDRLLCLIASVLRQQGRALDVVGRLGGDEFLVVLPMTTPVEARIYIRRVEKCLSDLQRLHPEFGSCSLSIGIAESPRHGTTVSSLLAAADTALYRAKRSGRDSVEVAEG